MAIGSNRGATSNLDGEFHVILPPGDYKFSVRYLGYKTQLIEISILDAEVVTRDFQMEPDFIGAEEVVVLGTRRVDRTVVDSPVPVDVISADEIRATGLTQTTEILQLMIPSLNAPKPAIKDGSDHVRPAMLRGLGPDQVLVLVNGKRRHSSALVHVNGSVGRGSTGVDLNAIPANAIDRIEVLRDGAAAQYGSDAIAGVINIILKKRVGLDASVSYGQAMSTEDRGYRKVDSNIDGEDDSTYDWDGPVESVSYSDGQMANLHMGYGLNIGEGTAYFSGQFRKKDSVNRAGFDPRQQYYPLDDGSDDPREAGYDRLNHHYGEGELDDISLFFNSSFPFGESGSSFYAFGGLSRRNGLSPCFFRRSGDDPTVRSIHPNGFLPQIATKIDDYSFSTGISGTLGTWMYDLSETYGSNAIDMQLENSNNVSMGTSSPTDFDVGGISFAQATTNIDFYREFPFPTGTPLSFAVGSEFRWENYQIIAGEAASYIDGGIPILDGPNAGDTAPVGSQGFPGFSPNNAQDESRTNVALYVDLENDLTEDLMMGVAARYENYSDFGSTMTGKIATRYSVSEEFAFRGAVSTGFRAPSLAQAYYSSVSTQFIDGQPFELGTFPVNTEVAKALGAKDLDAEKSINFSAGVTITEGNASFTVDGYHIRINDRIVFTEDFRGGDIADFLQTQGLSANGGRYFTNAVDTKTNGLDIIARYGMSVWNGKLKLTAAINLTETIITNKDEIDTPDELEQYTDIPLYGRVEQGRVEAGQPQSTLNFAANYDRLKWSYMVRTTRYGTVTDFNTNPARDQTFGIEWVTDAEVAYRINNAVRLSLGSNNIFDVYPDKNYKINSFNGIMPYSRESSPIGFMGRFIYARVTFSM